MQIIRSGWALVRGEWMCPRRPDRICSPVYSAGKPTRHCNVNLVLQILLSSLSTCSPNWKKSIVFFWFQTLCVSDQSPTNLRPLSNTVGRENESVRFLESFRKALDNVRNGKSTCLTDNHQTQQPSTGCQLTAAHHLVNAIRMLNSDPTLVLRLILVAASDDSPMPGCLCVLWFASLEKTIGGIAWNQIISHPKLDSPEI